MKKQLYTVQLIHTYYEGTGNILKDDVSLLVIKTKKKVELGAVRYGDAPSVLRIGKTEIKAESGRYFATLLHMGDAPKKKKAKKPITTGVLDFTKIAKDHAEYEPRRNPKSKRN